MLNRQSIIVAALFAGFLWGPETTFADARSVAGKFIGELTPKGCRPGPPYKISAELREGRATMKVMRGQSLDVTVESDGTFEGEVFLRKHRAGDKVQAYKGKVMGDTIEIEAWYGVHGHPRTQCSAHGLLQLTN